MICGVSLKTGRSQPCTIVLFLYFIESLAYAVQSQDLHFVCVSYENNFATSTGGISTVNSAAPNILFAFLEIGRRRHLSKYYKQKLKIHVIANSIVLSRSVSNSSRQNYETENKCILEFSRWCIQNEFFVALNYSNAQRKGQLLDLI